MNDTSRGGPHESSPGPCRTAVRSALRCSIWTATARSPERMRWRRRSLGFSLCVAIRTTPDGALCDRLSSIRRATRRGRNARGARSRWWRRTSSGLRKMAAGRRSHVLNTWRPSGAPNRSPFTSIRARCLRPSDWSAHWRLPTAGALRSAARFKPAHASRSLARSIAPCEPDQARSRRSAAPWRRPIRASAERGSSCLPCHRRDCQRKAHAGQLRGHVPQARGALHVLRRL